LSRVTVFEDDLTAKAAISDLYARMTVDNFLNVTYPASFSADELMIAGNVNDSYAQFYRNELLSINPIVEQTWRYHYTLIYGANSILEGLAESKITPALKNQLIGEAKFLRAFQYFYLINFFGAVPYVTTTDYRTNGMLSRMPVPQVYENIKNELTEARGLLASDYSYSNSERVRVNKWAAEALLARVYLYTEQWPLAEAQADEVISYTSLYSLNSKADFGKIFLKNNKEAIWQLIPNYPQKYTQDGAWLNKPYYIIDNPLVTNGLFDAFEANDERKSQWIGIGNDGTHVWYYPKKYKETLANGLGEEYSVVLRLAEQYLIRAEARAKQNKLTGAVADINIIRVRSGLQNTGASTQQELLTAIEQERRAELFTEWGHRWLDLKRTGRANSVLSGLKPNWKSTDLLYPIPYSELQLNPNMNQNPGN